MEHDLRERYEKAAEECFRESIRIKEALAQTAPALILDMALLLVQAFRANHKLLIFGNGGSAADSQHLAAEFVNRFQRNRPPLPAMALSVDTSVLTSIGNDFHFDEVFIKQLQALAQAGDVALGISTSGGSPNVVKALRWAREHGLHTMGWTGAREAEMDAYCDLILRIPSTVTARIQECHITAGHSLCLLVEEMIFGESETVA